MQDRRQAVADDVQVLLDNYWCGTFDDSANCQGDVEEWVAGTMDGDEEAAEELGAAMSVLCGMSGTIIAMKTPNFEPDSYDPTYVDECQGRVEAIVRHLLSAKNAG